MRQRIVRLPSEGRALEPWCCGEVEAGFLLSQKTEGGGMPKMLPAANDNAACSEPHLWSREPNHTTIMYCGFVTLRSVRRDAQLWCSCGRWSCRPHVISQTIPTRSSRRARTLVDQASTCRTTKRCSAVVLCGSKCLVPNAWSGAMVVCNTEPTSLVRLGWLPRGNRRLGRAAPASSLIQYSTRKCAGIEWLDGMSLECQRELD